MTTSTALKNSGREREEEFNNFLDRVDKELMTHPIIADNAFCKWFAGEQLEKGQLRYFTRQFSVFSNLFLIAQLKKMINAVDLEEMHKAKEILANEIGCVFRRTDGRERQILSVQKFDRDEFGDPKYVGTQGTVDGGTFRFKAAHFEWLLEFGKGLDLEFGDMGKRSHGSKDTVFFCDELERLYGSEDYNVSAGASFAVENWAAAGFWKQLAQGVKNYNHEMKADLPLGFFTWHDKVEDQHKQGTVEELEELYFGEHPFDEDLFLNSGNEMLDGVAVFWNGLFAQREERI